MFSVSETAELLLQARLNKKAITHLSENCCPDNKEAAYLAQDELTALMLNKFGGQKVGYKIACTNQTAQSLLTVDEPFYGPLLSAFAHTSSTKLRAGDFFMRVIEPEFAFQMAYDLPARAKEYTLKEVTDCIAAVVPSIEIVDSRYADWSANNSLSLIADNACNAGWVYGKPIANWSEFDLANQVVSVSVNGLNVRQGSGAWAMDNPVNALLWLINTLSRHGKELKANDYVSTGTTCQVYLAKLGDSIKADFGPIGTVELQFVS